MRHGTWAAASSLSDSINRRSPGPCAKAAGAVPAGSAAATSASAGSSQVGSATWRRSLACEKRASLTVVPAQSRVATALLNLSSLAEFTNVR